MRQCLRLLGVTLFFISSFLFAQPSCDIPSVGVQLHSVKQEVTQDFKSTIKHLAAMGFEGVEFAGRYGEYANNPAGLKLFLDSLGLKVAGAHVSIKQLRSADIEQKLNFFKELGTKLLIIPHDARVDNKNKIDELIIELKQLTQQVEKHGMKLGYHNHSKEFKPFNDSTFWDYLAQNTPQQFVLQLDVGWSNYAGKNSIEYVKRYPGRTLTTHYKIRTKPSDINKNKAVILGEDSFNWQALIKANIEQGATQWIVVEQEELPAGLTPLQAVAASKKGLDKVMQRFKYTCLTQKTVAIGT